MSGDRKINWIDRLVRPLRVIAYTQVQFDIFLNNHEIPRHLARRITRASDAYGLAPDQPIILLPRWYCTKDSTAIIAHWERRGGTTLEIPERVVLGEEPLCPNDTNRDGNCHICAHKMSCQWLVPEKKQAPP